MAYVCKLCEKEIRMYDPMELEENAWKHLNAKHTKEFESDKALDTEEMMGKYFREDDTIKCVE